MKISNKEKNLLVLLGIVLVIYLFFSFVYTPQSEKIESLKQNEQTKRSEYEQKMAIINSQKSLDEKIVASKKKLFTEARAYFGDVNQEDIIVILDDFAKKANLDIKSVRFLEPMKTSLSELGVGNAQEQAVAPPADAFVQAQDTQQAQEQDIPPQTQDMNAQVPDENQSSDNITTKSVEIGFESNYSNLMDYLVEVENYDKYISITSMSLNASEDNPLSGNMSVNFYCIDSVDKYSQKEASSLENNITNTLNSDPFVGYLWARPNTSPSNLPVPDINSLGIVNSIEDVLNTGSVNYPNYLSKGDEYSYIAKELVMTKDDTEYDEMLLYSFEDDILDNFSQNDADIVSSKLEENPRTNEIMYSMSYSFADGAYGREMYLDLDSKNLIIDSKPQYISLLVDADKRVDNILGIVVTDSRGMDYRVFLSASVDWINKKELRGVVLEDKNIVYPLKIKNVFVRQGNTTIAKNAKLSFDKLKLLY